MANKLRALAEVTKIETSEEYQVDADGKTEWGKPKVRYTESTLTILQNNQKIRGTFTVRQLLVIGCIYEIFINLDDHLKVIDETEVINFPDRPRITES